MIQAITQEAERQNQKQALQNNQYEHEQTDEQSNLNPTNEQEQNGQNKHNEHENEQNQHNDDKSNTQQQNQHIDLQQLQTNQQNDNEGQVVENMEIVGKQISMEEIQRQEEHQDIPVPGLEIIGTKIQTNQIHNTQNSEEEHLNQNVENDADVNYTHQNQGDSNQQQQQYNQDHGEQFKQNRENSISISQSNILEPSPASKIMSVHTSKIRGPSYEEETNLPTNVWVERGSEEFLPGSGSQPNIVPEYSETYEEGQRHGYENKNQFNERQIKSNPQQTEPIRQNIHDNQQVVHGAQINQKSNKGYDDEDIIEDVQKIKYQPQQVNQDGKTQEQSVYMVNSLSNIAVVHKNVSQQKKDEPAIIQENKESIRQSFNDNDESKKNTDNSYMTKGTEKNEKLSQIVDIDSRYVPEIEPVSKPSLIKATDENINGRYEAPPVIEQENETTPILERNQGSNVESIYSRRVLPSATKNKEIPQKENSQGAEPKSCAACNIM